MSISNIISDVKTRITTAKPYLVGGAIGAVAMLVVQFNAEWVVTTGTHEQQVAEARVGAMASVCAQQASAHWLTEGREMAALEGWSNDERDALAKRFTPQMSDIQVDAITKLCGRMLRQV